MSLVINHTLDSRSLEIHSNQTHKMTTKVPEHDLNHEVYIDPKDHKEHVNHGMIEYSESDLEMHNDAFHAHDESEVEPNEGKINDWHTRHEDKHLEVYCDNHPDSLECRVYDD